MSAFTSIYFQVNKRPIYNRVQRECERLDVTANAVFNKLIKPLHEALKTIPSADMSPIYLDIKPFRIK